MFGTLPPAVVDGEVIRGKHVGHEALLCVIGVLYWVHHRCRLSSDSLARDDDDPELPGRAATSRARLSRVGVSESLDMNPRSLQRQPQAPPRWKTHGSVVAIAVIGMLFAPKVLAAQQATAFRQVSITRVRPAPCPPAAPCTGATAAQTAPSSISVLPGGRFEARNQTIENMARVAFGFEQVDPAVGVVAESRFSSPDADRFDIDAVADRPWTPAPAGWKVPGEFRELLRRLLRERFKLQARVALTDVEVFALQLTRADRERGPGLRRSSGTCADADADRRDDDVRSQCGFRVDSIHIAGSGVTMSEFGAMINQADETRMDRFIIDQTGLSGRFDVTLSLKAQARDRRDALREAMKMQLGLKLVKTTVPLPTLIIEHAEAPPQN